MRLTPIQERQVKTFKAMADGTRMKMVAVMTKPMTVKQLADLIGEDHHKLYHHMRVLEQAGIVRLVETRTDSHIVEKYYELVENSMIINHKEFGPDFLPMLNSMVLQIAQTALNDLVESSKLSGERASASRIILRCAPEQFEEIRTLIQRHVRTLLAELQATEDVDAPSAYEMMVLHFPVFEAADPSEEGQNGSAVRKSTRSKGLKGSKVKQ